LILTVEIPLSQILSQSKIERSNGLRWHMRNGSQT